jgi:hypothetical protein
MVTASPDRAPNWFTPSAMRAEATSRFRAAPSWDRDPDAARKAAHRLWGNVALPGQLAQTLPRPKDFAAAMTLVTPEKVAQTITCGPDSDRHATQIRSYLDAGINEVYVQQIGPDMDGFFAAYEHEVLPQLRH